MHTKLVISFDKRVLNMLELNNILFFALILGFVIQMAYLWIVFARLAFYKPKSEFVVNQPVSVVIVAHNDYHHLIKTLDPILKQDYPQFEVVVVNESSDDETYYFLKDQEKIYPHLKLVQIDKQLNFFRGKKFPLSIGIKSAKFDTILLTDAYCLVSSNNWISSMQKAFKDKTEIVLGYAPYKLEAGFLNSLIRFDVLITAMHYLSFALLGLPYRGIGRNLAYSKKMFYQKQGFISHYKMSLGDDDLFINQSANKINTKICIDPDSFTYSLSEESFGQWLMKKKHNLSTTSLYKLKHKILLIVYPLSLFLFYISIIYLLVLNIWLTVVLILFAVRLLSFLLIQKRIMLKLKEQKLLLISPLLELLLFALQAMVMTLNIFNRRNKWN